MIIYTSDSWWFLKFNTEPGFYKDGHFGIRLENLVRVVAARPEHNFKDLKFLTFENLTFVPIQRKMIVAEMLTKVEVSIMRLNPLIEFINGFSSIAGGLYRSLSQSVPR